MELIYSFDSERFYLGSLCKHGHRWPGTNQSLRRTLIDARGRVCSPCVGCTGRKQSNWLTSFIDAQAMGLPDGVKLGKVCRFRHLWHGHEMTLRVKGRCEQCEEIRKPKKKAISEPAISRCEKRKRYKAQVRECLRQQGLTSRGTPVINPMMRASKLGDFETRMMWAAIRKAGSYSSIARLVANEQRRYWKENPDAARQAKMLWNREIARWKHLVDLDYKLYHRQKSKRRKAMLRGNIAHQIRPQQLRFRLTQFGHCCAYCGKGGDLHIEHVVPISKGGPHTIDNIVVACQRCNYSKGVKEVEAWYRSQSFFCNRRWGKIKTALGVGKGSPNQLSLLDLQPA